jgi:ketosteroid isomerase-like protein
MEQEDDSMTPTLALFRSLLLLSAAGLLAASPAMADRAVPIPEEARDAVATVDRFLAALKAGDLERAAADLDPELVVLEGGNAELSAEQYLALHAKQDAEFLKTATVDSGFRRARVHGDLAWVASLTEVQSEHEGKPLTIDGAESMVLKRVENGWRIVHIHWSSRVRPEEP